MALEKKVGPSEKHSALRQGDANAPQEDPTGTSGKSWRELSLGKQVLPFKFICVFISLFLLNQCVHAQEPSGMACSTYQSTWGHPIVISDITVARVGITSAVITWATDEETTGQVEYRKKGDRFYSLSDKDETLKTSNHVIVAQNLEPDVEYEYHVVSIDEHNKRVLSIPNRPFTTKASYPVAVQPSNPRLSIVGNPGFNYNSLTPDMKLWYDRLVESMATPNSYAEYNAVSCNTYRYREVDKYVSSMLMALRATGDLRFLDEAARIMQITRLSLKDAQDPPDPNMRGAEKCNGSRDGYLNWLYLEFYPKDGYKTGERYFGNDTMPLEECMTHGYIAAFAYALHMNRRLNPAYGEMADFWIDYLENHFLAKWYERCNGQIKAWSPEEQGGIVKRFTHPIASIVRLAYYLYKITGNDFYLDMANHYCSMLANHVTVSRSNSAAFVWKHQVWGNEQGYQEINYAQYLMIMIQELNIEKFGNYYPDSVMPKYKNTFKTVLTKFGSPWSKMANRVDGSEQTSFNMYNLTGLARWDTQGEIMNAARTSYRRWDFYNAAFAMLALSTRTVE